MTIIVPRTQHPSARRAGVTLIETLVSFSLLLTVLSITAPAIVRNQRLLTENRAYRCAVDEATNRLARLSAMPLDEATAAVAALPSQELVGALDGALLEGSISVDGADHRITVTLAWSNEPRRRPSVTLVGWLAPRPVNDAPDDASDETEAPAS